MKKFNSVATLCFSVEHDGENEITEAEFKAAIERRLEDLNAQSDGFEQACGADWFDTQLNADMPICNGDDDEG